MTTPDKDFAAAVPKLERSIDRWRGTVPSAVMAGSNAQIQYALEDARKDILALDRSRQALLARYEAMRVEVDDAQKGLRIRSSRDSLARHLAALDGITLHEIRSTVGPAEDANNWREYLGRADDLLAWLSADEAALSQAKPEVL